MPVALITGASSGIGAATARALAAAGWDTVLVARRADRLTALAAALVATGTQALAVPGDITAAGTGARVVASAIERFGRIDAVVNNAGVFAVADLAACSDEHIERLWRVNVQAPIAITREALPHLCAVRGAVINVSSVAAEATFTGCGVYSATKSAIDTWSRILREELRGAGVRVGVIAPGATATEAFPGELQVDPERLCRVDDIAAAIVVMLRQPPTANIDRLVIAPPGGPL